MKGLYMKKILMLVLLVTSIFSVGCVTNATEGEVQVQVVRGNITRIIRPSDGWVNTASTFGDDYYDISTRAFTDKIDVGASTKDNAALKITVAVTGHVLADDESIKAYVRKFGLDSASRTERVTSLMTGHVSTETKNAIAAFDAYSLLANQEAIQKQVTEALKPILKQQLYIELESVQIIDRPDFLDDRIEAAASQVVANSKLKEAAQMSLDAARVDAEKKQVEAKTFSDPALLKIKLLELQLQIEQARAEGIKGHQGSLTIVNGVDHNTQIQLKNN